MSEGKHLHLDFNKNTRHKNEPRQEEYFEFDLKDFVPEIYDCEADGSCSSGHQHVNVKM